MSKFYITTSIYYINAVPHIGHSYEATIADIAAIWHRMRGDDTFFLTGLDENSIKTAQAAKDVGEPDVQKYTDQMAVKWKSAWKELKFTNDDFIRTTEERHRKNVLSFFDRVNKKGDIYKGSYEGLYCEGCEEFKLERDVVDGKCPVHQKPLSRVKEENYFFKLSKYQDQILKHIEENRDFIKPESRKHEIVNFIKEGLRDTSISRPNLNWGIDFPLDKKQKFWVWFDALINYLIPEKYWPADVHVLGKDIARFHCITWIGMLMSAGYPLPKTIYIHGYFTANGQKISKSLGNAVDPVALSKKYSTDAVRYYTLRDISIGSDGDFSEKSLKDRINNEIVANYSNLFYRTTAFLEKNFDSAVPQAVLGGKETEILSLADLTVGNYEKDMLNLELSSALNRTVELTSAVNKYFQDGEPWKKIKEGDKPGAANTLNISTNLLRTLSILYYPFMPEKAGAALSALGAKPEWKDVAKPMIAAGQKIKAEMLFKKIE
jgi:methionyl-tRNA synthetase